MTSSWDINAVFKLFYEDLYTSEITASIEELESFFDKLTIPKVLLEEKAINAMKTGKSPGVDGFTAEYYQKFTDILAPFLTKVFQEAFQYRTLPESFNQAIIKLLSKDDKDLTDPTNFR
uniref:Reverse transcriptase domain-containing protein n=1 Tax=Neolamprologus brichardi TaxID=32507 RepID=A0A3Q4M6J3_NEOBR